MGRNVLPLGHNILIPSQPVIALTPKCVNNYPTKLRLKIKFFWSDKNGVVGSKLSFK
jgi:hypothetical protein